MPKQFVSLKKVSLTEAKFNESVIRDTLAEGHKNFDLNLGDLSFIEKEKKQEDGSRLDLLFEDQTKKIRYAIELQRGVLNFDHVGRAIEYWALERAKKGNAKYRNRHCAVIIAETIPNRACIFVKALSDKIPFVLIEMQVYRFKHEGVTKDHLGFTIIEDTRPTDFKLKKTNLKNDKEKWITMELGCKLMRKVFALVKQVNLKQKMRLNYNQVYIGIDMIGVTKTAFVSFRPQKNKLVFQLSLPEIKTTTKLIQKMGLKLLRYTPSHRNYEIGLLEKDINTHKEHLKELIDLAYKHRF